MVAIEGAGIVCIEVKDGEVWHDGNGWCQTRGDRVHEIEPVRPAREACYALRDFIESDPRWTQGRLRWDHVVVLPNAVIANSARKLLQSNDDTVVGDVAVGDDAADTASNEMGLINAFGMFWRRHACVWQPTTPRILGVQQSGSAPVDFAEQVGFYVLCDGSRPIYVGRVSEPRMGARLVEHTRDRLNGRWDRFSWFGVRGVNDDGSLGAIPEDPISLPILIAAMEALIIEGLEPPQNRRQGDGFNAVEFIQADDPERERQQRARWLQDLSQR